jgi:hypothetical protein
LDPREIAQSIVKNVEGVIIGKRQQVELAVMTLMCGGCLLIEDAPGEQLCIISGEGPGPAAGDLCHLTSVHLQPSDCVR